jgi:hypothetical protein
MIVIFTFFFLLGSVCSSFGAQNETGRVTLSDSNFQDGSTLLKPEAAKVLRKIQAALKADPNLGVRIEGYSDNQGTAAENRKIAQQRAQAVLSWFVNNGIESGRLEAKGIVDSAPIADNATAAGQALNRRVEIATIALKAPAVFFPETSYTFDPVADGVYVTHDFVVHNKGDGLLRINRVRTG